MQEERKNQRFNELSIEDKAKFFENCQRILIQNHPKSEFLLTKENLEEKKYFALDFIKKYKGYCYWDNNISILFNKFLISDPRNPKKELKDHLFKEPEENYNCVLVDFVTFVSLKDCISFIKWQYNDKIKYCLFVKNNEVKLYKADKLIEKLNSPLINFL